MTSGERVLWFIWNRRFDGEGRLCWNGEDWAVSLVRHCDPTLETPTVTYRYLRREGLSISPYCHCWLVSVLYCLTCLFIPGPVIIPNELYVHCVHCCYCRSVCLLYCLTCHCIPSPLIIPIRRAHSVSALLPLLSLLSCHSSA